MADPHIRDVRWHAVDLVDRQSVRALAEHANKSLGGIDILVGNAGATYAEQVQEVKTESVDALFQLHMTSNLQLAQAFLPRMEERKWGRFIFSSSIGSIMNAPLQGTFIYNSAKAAVNAFARSLAGDLGRANITANAIILGFFMTDILTDAVKEMNDTLGAKAAKDFLNMIASNTALGRIGDPAEIEGLIQLLASDAGGYITGTNTVIDGGMSIMMRALPIAE
jgi:NAD(P)-dependent dehydrogenase (short-subunit alcohol dehydrogenase family)